MSVTESLIELTKRINAATTEAEHRDLQQQRQGFLLCMEAAGMNVGRALIECDLSIMDAYPDRPMCGGELLDWEVSR